MNKSLNIVIIFLLVITTILAASASKGEETTHDHHIGGGTKSRFLGHIPYGSKAIISCEKNPKVCKVEGSTGPDCCNNKCVNLETDSLNCGKCGKKCGSHKICCEGKCVNSMSNEKHCGKCGHQCDDGSSCLYGMCNYA